MFKIALTNKTFFFLTILLLGISLRLYGLSIPAQPYDIGTYHAWGNHILTVGPKQFFDSIWSDYLPLPILTFSIPALISHQINPNFGLVFKLLNTIYEIILAFSIASLFPKKKIIIFSLLFLSPPLLGNTSFWGQVDAIPSLLALLSLSLLHINKDGRKSTLAAILYGLSVAYKPIMILISPILWYVATSRKKFFQFPLVSGATFFLTALPFVSSPLQVFSFMWSRATEQAGTYPYLSINAWNLWTITGEAGWIADSNTILGVSGRSLGILLFLFVTFLLFRFYHRHELTISQSYHLSAAVLTLFYTVTTRMHERHLLFGLPFLALALVTNIRLSWEYLILSLCYTLNLYSAYMWVIDNQVWPLPPEITILSSWLTVFACASLILKIFMPEYPKRLLKLIKSNLPLVAILILATLLRFVNLSHPKAYIFDEVYHGFTAKEYLHNHIEAWEWWTTPPEGVAYEWTHPPIAKYGMVLGMLLVGEGELGYRVGSAVAGVVGILGLYVFIFTLTRSRSLALLSSFLMTIEGTHIAQSRIAMNDSYMLAFYLWALVAAVRSRWRSVAILYGLALGSKWSALYGAVPLAFMYVYQTVIILRPKPLESVLKLLSALRYVLIALGIYILSFAPFILAGHTWQQWWELQRQMWYYHTNLVATHGYQSTPLQWIFVARPVWYWVEYGTNVISNIYVQGNPLVLWVGLIALLLQLRNIFSYQYALLYILYTIFTLPWVASPRIMFYYHYLPGTVFLMPILASWLLTFPKKVLYITIFSFILSLLLVSPMLYGFPLPTVYWNSFFRLFPNWK